MDSNTLFVVAMISAVIIIVSVPLSIFLLDNWNQKRIEKLFEKIDRHADVKQRNQRFNKIEVRLDNIERRLFQPILPPK